MTTLEQSIADLEKASAVAPSLVRLWLGIIQDFREGDRAPFHALPPCEQAFLLVVIPDIEILFRHSPNAKDCAALQSV